MRMGMQKQTWSIVVVVGNVDFTLICSNELRCVLRERWCRMQLDVAICGAQPFEKSLMYKNRHQRDLSAWRRCRLRELVLWPGFRSRLSARRPACFCASLETAMLTSTRKRSKAAFPSLPLSALMSGAGCHASVALLLVLCALVRVDDAGLTVGAVASTDHSE